MPAAVIGAIGTAAGWTAATIATVTAVTQVALFIGGLALSSYQRKQAKKKQIEAYNAAQVDRLANVVTTIAPRDLVLGRVRKGGAITFRGSAGAYKETFLTHLALAGHEIDAVERVYLADKAVSLDASGHVLDAPYAQTRRQSFNKNLLAGVSSTVLPHTPVAGTIKVIGYPPGGGEDSAVYAPSFTVSGRTVTMSEPLRYAVTVTYQANITTYYARVWWELGDEDATVDARTLALFPSLWSNNHRGRGVAKMFAEFTYNETAFPSGIPVLSAQIRGAKVYDPRDDTTAWSENPALLARHVYTHPFFGKATPSAAEDERFVAAANVCDTAHSYVVTGGTTVNTQLYRAALVVPFGGTARAAIDDLCQAMAGISAWAGGEIFIKAGAYTAPVMTLTDADLAVVQRDGDQETQDPISIVTHRERVQKFNVVNARIWDSEQAYKQVGLEPYKATELIARDGQQLAQEMQMSAVFFAPQAKHIAGVALRDARDPLTFEAPFKLRAYPLELFDTVEVTLARYGWVAKTFMVLARTWDRERGVIRLTMKETAAQIYTPDAAFEAEGYSENTSLPAPYDIEPPEITEENISSGTSELVALPDGTYQTRVHVTWPLVNSAAVQDGQIELQWQEIGTDFWHKISLPGDSTGEYITGPVDGKAILIRARSRTELAVSDWSLQVTHVVVGKSEPPSAPSAVAVTRDLVIFTPSPDIDVKGYRILYNEGEDTERSVARELHTGLVAGSPWALPARLYGVNTIIVVAVDAVGNESEAAYDTQDLGDPDVANVAHEFDHVAAGFPGTVVSGAIDGAAVEAEGSSSADIYGAASGGNIYYRDGAADIYGGDQFQALEYRFTYASPYNSGTILMDLTVEGPRPGVEFRVDGSAIGDFYADDRSDNYSDDGVLSAWGTLPWGSPYWWGGGAAGIYGLEQGWQPWTGAIAPTTAHVGYEFRITVEEGSTQGRITELAMRTELPQVDQSFGSVAVSAAGTFVDPADGLPVRHFIAIEDVQITPIGSSAVAGRVKTFPIDPETGPEIELIDASASPVSGNAFVRMSGY